MSMLGMLIAGSGATTPPLDIPVVLNNGGAGDSNVGSSASTTSSTVAPTASGAILIVLRTRSSASGTHNTPTTTSLTNLGSITLVDQIEQPNSTPNIWWRTSVWKAKFSGAAGTGTVTCTTSATTTQQQLSVVDLGTHATAGITLQSATNGATELIAGTSIAATLAATPKADSVVLEIGTSSGVATSHTQESGYTKLTDSGTGNMEWMTAYRQFGAAASAAMSVTSGKTRSMIVVEIAHQN